MHLHVFREGKEGLCIGIMSRRDVTCQLLIQCV